MQSNSPTTEYGEGRIYWIEALKCSGIAFVILGHTSGLGGSFRSYIYSFHMPLFFFISGFLLKESSLEKSFAQTVKKYFYALIVPYFVFGLLTYIPWLILQRHFGYRAELHVDWYRPLVGLIYGIGAGTWLAQDTPLWFFVCLFVTHLLFYGIAMRKRFSLIAVLLILSAVIGFISLKFLPFRLPWSIEISMIAVSFYGFGFLIQGQKYFLERPSKVFSVGLLLVLTTIQLVSIVNNNVMVDMNNGRFGNPFYFFTGAFSGILVWMLVAQYLPRIKLASIISRESVVLFPLHAFIFTLITGFCVFLLKLPYDFKNDSLTASFVYTIVTIAVLLPVAQIIRTRAPGIIGAQKPDRTTGEASRFVTKTSPVSLNQIAPVVSPNALQTGDEA